MVRPTSKPVNHPGGAVPGRVRFGAERALAVETATCVVDRDSDPPWPASSERPIIAKHPNLWTDVHDERESLLSLLESLSPAEWDQPSLCTGWRVRDVVGHMVSETTMTIPQVALGVIGVGFRLNRYIESDARRRGSIPVDDLVEEFRVAVGARTHLRGLSSLSMLVDIVVHSLDIRRPLQRRHQVPASRMVRVATDVYSSKFFAGQKLFRDLQLTATDSDWTAGHGPSISGPIGSLILAMSGRPLGLDELHGAAMATVHQRAATP